MNKRDFWLEAGGKRLEARWLGDAPDDTVPTLVFLHEGLGCVELWKGFPERMATDLGCPALVYSRAGYGRSEPVELPRPLTYMHDEGLEVLPEVLDAAGIQKAVLVGHSDGASIALINAGGVRDSRVEGLVLMAPHVFNEPLCVRSIEKAREAYLNGDLRSGLARYHHENVDVAFWGWNQAWLDPGFLEWNLESYLPSVEVPILLLQGYDDEYGTSAQIRAIENQSAGPTTTIWLNECGHSVFRDRPDEVVRATVDFLPACCPA